MNRTELSRLVSKLYHRRKFATELPDLEGRLTAYLEANNLSGITIAGYRVELAGTKLVITLAPAFNQNQLSLIPDYFCLNHERRSVTAYRACLGTYPKKGEDCV